MEIYHLSEAHKILVRTLADGCPQALPIIHTMEEFKRRDDIYRWLISNNIIGAKFVNFAREYGFSKLRLYRAVMSRMKPIDDKPVTGEDFLK